VVQLTCLRRDPVYGDEDDNDDDDDDDEVDGDGTDDVNETPEYGTPIVCNSADENNGSSPDCCISRSLVKAWKEIYLSSPVDLKLAI
jgi:hypothetical protein